MKRSTKFCRCIKTVRKRVGEKGAIGICVHSILQRKGRTLKKFNCGKKPRLVTQKLKKKGGSTPTWETALALTNEIKNDEDVENQRQKLDILKGMVKTLPRPQRGTGDIVAWGTMFIGLLNRDTRGSLYLKPGLSDLVLDIEKELLQKFPQNDRLFRAAQEALERFKNSRNPEENQISSVLLPYLYQSGGAIDSGATWARIVQLISELRTPTRYEQAKEQLKLDISAVGSPEQDHRSEWRYAYLNLRGIVSQRPDPDLVSVLVKLVEMKPSSEAYTSQIRQHIDAMKKSDNPSVRDAANDMEAALSRR